MFTGYLKRRQVDNHDSKMFFIFFSNMGHAIEKQNQCLHQASIKPGTYTTHFRQGWIQI